jgi:hypothetical protein
MCRLCSPHLCLAGVWSTLEFDGTISISRRWLRVPRWRPLPLLDCLVTVNVNASAAMEGEGQTAAAPAEICSSEIKV